MGFKETDFEFSNPAERLRKNLRTFFLEQLKNLRLTTEQINIQNSEQLVTSLETVNDAIERADSFGVFSFSIGAEGSAVIVASKTKSHVEMGILPLLLEAKKLILERLAELRKQEHIENLEQLVCRVSDDSLREKLFLELNNLNSQLILWRNKFEELEKQQIQEIDTLQTDSAQQISQLTNTLKLARRGKAVYRISLGSLIGILGISTIFYFPNLLNWQWLLTHPKRLPIQVSLSLVTLGLSWLVIDSNSNRRWFVFGSIVVAASLGLLGLL
jgi:hypothetical protein